MGLNWLANLLGRLRIKPLPPPTLWTTTTTSSPAPPPPVSPATEIHQKILDATNQFRQYQGLAPLGTSPKLIASAQGQADYMALNHIMTHQGPGEPDPWQRMLDAGYHYGRAAENVAATQAGVPDVMTAWENSPGHRANILGLCHEMGGAMAQDDHGTNYWCVDFGTPVVGMQFHPDQKFHSVSYFGDNTSSMAIEPVLAGGDEGHFKD